jgi:hypothetical protein
MTTSMTTTTITETTAIADITRIERVPDASMTHRSRISQGRKKTRQRAGRVQRATGVA